MGRRRDRQWSWGALVLAGCFTDTTNIDFAPCPCLDDWICCPSTARCVEALDDCPGSTADDAATTPDQDVALPDEGASPQQDASLRLSVSSVEPTSGPSAGGTRLTLQGQGFTPTLEVLVDGAACDALEVSSPEQATCLTPPWRGAGLEVAVVARASGETASAPVPFRYDVQPLVVAPLPAALSTAWGTSLAAVDIDDDGLAEVIIGRHGGSAPALALNHGQLRFTDGSDRPWVVAMGEFVRAVPADLDGDGRDDLLLSPGLAPGRAALELLHGIPGGFELPTAVVPRAETEVPRVLPLDLDADGDLDLVGCRAPASAPERIVVAWENRGELVERPDWLTVDTARLGVDFYCENPRVGDLDGDGDADLVLTGSGLVVLRNEDGHLTDFSAVAGVPARFAVGGWAGQLVDFDLDGDLDLGWTNGAGYRVGDLPNGTFLLANDGSGVFSAVGDLERPQIDPCPASRAPGSSLAGGNNTGAWLDVDADGDQDYLSVFPFSGCGSGPRLYTSHFAEGRAELSSGELVIGRELINPSTGLVADLDADGDDDLLTMGYNWDGELTLFRGTAADLSPVSTLRVRVQDAAGADAWGAPVQVDLDGPDLDPDFVAGPRKLAVRSLGDGGGILAPGPAEATFGLAGHEGPVWVRARLVDGTWLSARVDARPARVVLRP